jgi:hypothetical protein
MKINHKEFIEERMMKTFTLFTIIVILLLPIQLIAQISDKFDLRPDNLLKERIIPHSFHDDSYGHTSESDNFNSEKSRTFINKTLIDGGYLLIEYIVQGWDGSAWVNAYMYSYTYDENNNRIEELIQSWDGSVWVNYSKSSNTYNLNNNLIETLGQGWNGSAWVNSSKSSNTYNLSNNLIETLGQIWDDSTWVNSWKDSFTYDGNNNRTEWLTQSWVGTAWVNSAKQTYTYDGNNNLTEWLRQSWYGSNWLNFSKEIYSYLPTGIEQFLEKVSSFRLAQNYPNPFNPGTKIKFTIADLGFTILKVYDILGNEIATLLDEYKQAGTYEVEWNATGLPSGIYFYQLKAGEFIETKKMVLMK